MDEYRNVQNLNMVTIACSNMLAEKFNIRLPDDKLRSLVQDVAKEVIAEYANIHLKVKELNNITLSKIKNLYHSPPGHANTSAATTPTTSQMTRERSFTQVDILDDDTMSCKLKELEAKRKIIPSFQETNISEHQHAQLNLNNFPTETNVYKPNPISISLPSNMHEKILYKNFIINSLNRDWERSPLRNHIKFNVSFDLYNNTFYPQCICFPKFVKNITPYVIMNINDSVKNLFYSFTCPISSSSNDSKWDIWYPVDDVESISLQNKSWSIKFYDFMNNELDIGSDSIKIVEAAMFPGDINKFSLKVELDPASYDNNFAVNDLVYIKIYNGKTYLKKVLSYEKASPNSNINIMTISDDKNELVLEDFINSKIMNTNNQYSILIKYHYNK